MEMAQSIFFCFPQPRVEIRSLGFLSLWVDMTYSGYGVGVFFSGSHLSYPGERLSGLAHRAPSQGVPSGAAGLVNMQSLHSVLALAPAHQSTIRLHSFLLPNAVTTEMG